MGLLQKIAQNWKQKRAEDEERDDEETTDKYLRSLRRERRLQLEEVEKEQLKKDIAAYKKSRARRYLWGVKERRKSEEKDKIIKALKKKKRLNIMKNGHNILKEKKGKLKESKTWVGKTGF